MRLYLVRHGESELNTVAHQFAHTKLSSRGAQQAEILADRLVKLPVEIIFSSSYTRAQHTAEVVNGKLQKPIIYTELLKERKRPSEIEGKPIGDPEIVRVKKLIGEHAGDPEWHYADEENLFDFRRRVEQALGLISQREESHILVISHGQTIRMMVALMMLGEQLTPRIAQSFIDFLRTSNTGITVCERQEDQPWRLVTWNDHAHLG